MSSPAPAHGDRAPLRVCENCHTALQGGFCHLCGQPEASPVRHAGHAVEEVFESFWHLDGRIFRTLRRLWVPGRIANEYLSGHRVRYVAPMRLFVILTALAFFVAQFLVGSDGAPVARINAGSNLGTATAAMHEADSIAEVERIRDEVLAELAQARAQLPPYMPGLDASIVSAEGGARRAATTRIGELRAAGSDAAAEPGPDAPRAPPRPVADATPVDWGHPEGMERLGRNVEQLVQDPRAFLRALLGAAPMALFITVPLFAVMLKLAYLFKRRLYLEHLVVALYSHAWLMVVLLLYFGSVLASGWLAPRAAWTAAPLWWLQVLLLALMPLYLLWTQKRVYRQTWPRTLLKYGVVGIAYMILFVLVASFVIAYVLFTM